MAPWSYEVETPSSMFMRSRRDRIHFPSGDISPGSPASHNSDSEETTSEDRSQSGESGGGLPSPPIRSLRRSSSMTCNPDCYDPCAWEHLKKGECSGFIIKSVYWTYTEYIRQHYMAGNI